ncbi:MAG: guanylate kinase, partial [Planctomycetota bacterium]
MPSPFLLVVTGPSGSGKSTLIARLLADCPWLRKVVTATTRAMRPREIDGREYHFLSPERFRALLDEGGLLEHETYAGFEYGTPISELERPGETAEGIVLDLDIRGARTLRRLHPSRTSVVF